MIKTEPTVTSSYRLAQAIEDGVVYPVFAPHWGSLSAGKPIVATAAIRDAISDAGLMEIWNEFVHWRRHILPTLPEEDQLFTSTMDGSTVWVIEDGEAFTILYPADY